METNGRPMAPHEVSEHEVADHLIRILAKLLDLAPDTIDPDVPLSGFGIDSLTSTRLAAELERRCGFPVERELLLGRPSVAEVAEDVVAALRSRPATGRS
ncbi:acyl carrier protein [Streptomyces sp. NPDC049099]|uniref:acyl carrier protein n=1 Tax=unclassified Streptomyces TaxID=2593676 RepID=UPI003439EACA